MFWLRLFLISWLILFAVLKQCRHFIARLPTGLLEIVIASFFVAAGLMAFAFYMSLQIGFPMPFPIGVESPSALVLLVIAMVLLWGRLVKGNSELQKELLRCIFVVMTQLSFTYIYPGCAFVFRKLGPLSQTAFALLLPMMKILAKNWISFLLRHHEDLKPEFIIFNVEVFHALFVSACMQAAASFHTTMVLLGMDFVFGVLSLHRILKTIRKFYVTVHRPLDSQSATEQELVEAMKHATQWKQMHFLEAAIYILDMMGVRARNRTGFTIPLASEIPVQQPLRSMHPKLAKQIRQLPEEDKQLVLALDEANRLRFVQHVLGVLFRTEFILLIEFTEVVIPTVYWIDADTLRHNISLIVLYALLEGFTLFCMIAMLQRRLHISTTRQLAFVLETQWQNVQAKLILWVVFSLQTSVLHFGVDFTFKFAWLDAASQQSSASGGVA
ncbi:hypothetical protein FI667_g3472, partial [Globisporangium splendens]